MLKILWMWRTNQKTKRYKSVHTRVHTYTRVHTHTHDTHTDEYTHKHVYTRSPSIHYGRLTRCKLNVCSWCISCIFHLISSSSAGVYHHQMFVTHYRQWPGHQPAKPIFPPLVILRISAGSPQKSGEKAKYVFCLQFYASYIKIRTLGEHLY